MGKVPYYSSIILLSPPSHSVFQTILRMVIQRFTMGKELVLQQYLQTEREPEIETEIECPRCYDIMTLCYDFDVLYYFCEECNLSLLINYES
jgi:hypothetical protein